MPPLPEGMKLNLQQKPPSPFLWKGPQDNSDVGGVTFSSLSKFLTCRERFRLRYILGWRTVDSFNKSIEYGNLHHCGEEAFAKGEDPTKAIVDHSSKLLEKYPNDSEQIKHWTHVCLKQFPEYTKYWEKHPDVTNRTNIFAEKVFKVPVSLPFSGRIVYLRGKWDSVDLIKGSENPDDDGIYIQENKTKGEIDEDQLVRNLPYDMQSMMYLAALERYARNADRGNHDDELDNYPIKGVKYNCIKRPLSGGKGSIKRLEARYSEAKKTFGQLLRAEETWEEYYERMASYIREEPQTYFMRWKTKIERKDVERFESCTLFPILEQVCDWYDWVTTGNPWRKGNKLHFIYPMGIMNSINEYQEDVYDKMIFNGDTVGLRRSQKIFEELQ